MLVPIFVSPMVLAFGYVVALGPVGILSTAGRRPDRLRAVEYLFAALADRDRRPHPCAARLSLHVRGAARPRQRRRGSRAHRRRRSAAGRGRRDPADDPAGPPVRRRAGVLPRLRAVRPAAGAGRSRRASGAGDLSVQAHQQARHAVLSPDGGGGGDASWRSRCRWCFMQRQLLQPGQRYVSITGKGLRAAPLPLGIWRWPAFIAIALWLLVTIVVPLSGITLRSFVENWGDGVELSRGAHARRITASCSSTRPRARHGQHARHRRDRRRARGRLLHGDRAGHAPQALARWTRVVDYLVMVPRAMPGLVAGLALLWVFLFVKPLTPLRETLIFGLARLHHRVARLRHAADFRHAAAGRRRSSKRRRAPSAPADCG